MKLNKPIFVISKRAESLAKALKISPQAITIWVRSGKFKNKLPLIQSVVAFEAKSTVEAEDYVKRFVAVFCPPKSRKKLSVLRGMSKNQISQLLTYTKKDSQIKKYTHDAGRFKNTKTFAAWKKRKKTIYCLVSKKGKLLGIIWFSKKSFRNYKTSIAVRVYPPVRGKGISGKFMRLVYGDYLKNRKSPNLWLRTTKQNTKAVKLYRRFGFKIASENEGTGEVIMTFRP